MIPTIFKYGKELTLATSCNVVMECTTVQHVIFLRLHTVLSLINAPGALQFFKRGMFIRGKFSMQKCSV